jgi:hypothetical protein
LLVLVLAASCGSTAEKGAAAGNSVIEKFLADNKLQGSVVLVEFGTVGCELSDKGLDAMAEMLKRGAVPGLAFARLEAVGDDQAFKDYYAKKAITFPVVRDAGMKVANALGTTVFPQFALLDKFGRTRFRGSMPVEKDLAEWVKKLQAETADPGPDAAMFGKAGLASADLLAATKLPDLAGAVKPLAGYKGKGGLVLAFVDTRCPYSNAAIKQMPQVAPVLTAVGLPAVLVNIGEAASDVKKTYAGDAAGAPVVYDTSRQTQQCWNVQFVPTVVLLDSAGNLVYHGSPVWANVAAAAEKMLGMDKGSIKIDAEGTKGG